MRLVRTTCRLHAARSVNSVCASRQSHTSTTENTNVAHRTVSAWHSESGYDKSVGKRSQHSSQRRREAVLPASPKIASRQPDTVGLAFRAKTNKFRPQRLPAHRRTALSHLVHTTKERRQATSCAKAHPRFESCLFQRLFGNSQLRLCFHERIVRVSDRHRSGR